MLINPATISTTSTVLTTTSKSSSTGTGTIPTTQTSVAKTTYPTLPPVLQPIVPGLGDVTLGTAAPLKAPRRVAQDTKKCSAPEGFHDHHVHLNGILSGSEYVHMLFQGKDKKESLEIARELHKTYSEEKLSIGLRSKTVLDLEASLYTHTEQNFITAYGERRNLLSVKTAAEQQPLVKASKDVSDLKLIALLERDCSDGYAAKFVRFYQKKVEDFEKNGKQELQKKHSYALKKLKHWQQVIKGLEASKTPDTTKLAEIRAKEIICKQEEAASRQAMLDPQLPSHLLNSGLRATALLALISVHADGKRTFNQILGALGCDSLDTEDPRGLLIPIRKKMIGTLNVDTINPKAKGFYIVDADTSFKDKEKRFSADFKKFYDSVKANNLVIYLDKDPVNCHKKRHTGRLILDAYKRDKSNIIKIAHPLLKFVEVILIAKSLYEQNVRIADIGGRFCSGIHPRFIDGIFASIHLDARMLITYTSKNAFGRKAPVRLSDVIKKDLQSTFTHGIDFVGREPQFTSAGMDNLQDVYKTLHDLSDPKSNTPAKILRIHGGEGFGADSKEDTRALGLKNIELLLGAFSSLSKAGHLNPNRVEIRVGHFTHCTADDLFTARKFGVLLEFNLLSNIATGSIKAPEQHPFLTSLMVDYIRDSKPTFTFGTDSAGVMGKTQEDADMRSVYQANALLIDGFIKGGKGEIMQPTEPYTKGVARTTKEPLKFSDLTTDAQEFMIQARDQLEAAAT